MDKKREKKRIMTGQGNILVRGKSLRTNEDRYNRNFIEVDFHSNLKWISKHILNYLLYIDTPNVLKQQKYILNYFSSGKFLYSDLYSFDIL